MPKQKSKKSEEVKVPSPEPKPRSIVISGGWALFFLFIIILPLSLFFWHLSLQNTIFPGVHVGNLDMSRQTKEEATQLLQNYTERLRQTGIVFSLQGRSITLYPSPLSLDPDITPDAVGTFIDFDIAHTVDAAFAVGRQGSFFEKLRFQLSGFFSPVSIPFTATIQSERLNATLKEQFSSFTHAPQNARFHFKEKVVSIEEEWAGQDISSSAATALLASALREVKYPPSLSLLLAAKEPSIKKNDLEPFLREATDLLNFFPLTLTSSSTETFFISAEQGGSWLTLDLTQRKLILDEESVRTWLTANVASKVFLEARPPILKNEEGKLTVAAFPQQGRSLDVEATLRNLSLSFNARERSSELALKEEKAPSFGAGDLADIKEIIGEGVTDFKGSSANRMQNIRVGSAKLNGVLLKPDEIFSTVDALGEIDAKNGYKPELVIKGPKLTPEYGGGVCQISTTVFRAATFTGLPIIEQRNHAFRVSYYEPPIGFDATIYGPKPDLRFLNDTGHAVLVQTKIEGTKLIVTLWGTKDGRHIEVDPPKVLSISKAPPPKIVETTDLKPGEKKCKGKGIGAATARFERRITYSNGEKKTDVFTSRYSAWPAVCLVGKATLENSPEQKSESESVND